MWHIQIPKYLHPYSNTSHTPQRIMKCTWTQEHKVVKIQQNSVYNYLNSIFILPVTSHTPQNFVEFYNELWNVRDRRLDDWFMMSSIWPTVTLCVFYWYCSIVLGYTNTGCGVFNGWIQNYKGFWLKINGSQMKSLNFVSVKSAEIWLSKSIFYVRNHPNLSDFFYWRIQI